MLSLGKLSQLAQLHETEASVNETILDCKFCSQSYRPHAIDSLLVAFHDDLDVVSVQEKLMEEFKAVTAATRGKQSLDAQIETIARAKASGLTETPPTAKTALLQVINSFLKFILRLVNLIAARSSKTLSETFFKEDRCQSRT